MQAEIDELYEGFMEFVQTMTPADAFKLLTRFGSDDAKIEAVRARHEAAMLAIREKEHPKLVQHGNRMTWYSGPRKGDRCYPAVESILNRDGWNQAALESLDESSTSIVSMLDHPKQTAFASRGLVVGYVQSGKTTSFTSVMAKAADRGYKLFIVLSGIHNGLRRQTQERLIQQLVEPNPDRWHQLTSTESDFTPTANPASYFGAHNKTHVLCVVKKNATVLRKLSKWLENAGQYLDNCPTLIIDDEADQATVATKSINPLIRRIMDALSRSVYLGYTASPFANLLIDPAADDLYPRDFIINLPQPAGHFGTEVLFGREALPGETSDDVDDGHDMIREVPADEVDGVRPRTSAEVDGFVPEIDGALETSMRYFLLATAARRARGTGNRHSTMLIHTSTRVGVHNSFREPLTSALDDLENRLSDEGLVDELEALWEQEGQRVDPSAFGEERVSFDQLLPELADVVGSCRVIMDNSTSDDRLDYGGRPVVAIAVGGNTLSRGLTLEGLVVSYFVRSVSAYDTLLQMGRWFGFRNGYADLPRIWMTSELERWFRHLATVEEEMRRDIEMYMEGAHTPTTFAVRLRTHPALRVTAAAKMKDAVQAASSYGQRRVQTHLFDLDPGVLAQNAGAASTLVGDAVGSGSRPGLLEGVKGASTWLLRDVSHELVLDFLSDYSFHPDSKDADARLLSDYIRRRNAEAGALRLWNVAVVGNAVDGVRRTMSFGGAVEVGTVVRSRLVTTGTPDIKTLMSRRDAAVDVAAESQNLSEAQIFQARRAELPDHGLLVLYPIDRVSEPVRPSTRRRALDAPGDVVGVGFVFPTPSGVDSEVQGYVSADLAGIRAGDIEDEDLSGFEEGE